MKDSCFLILGVILMISFSSCKKEPNDNYFDSITCNDPDDSLNTYNQKIGEIFNLNCVHSGCHDNGTHKGKVNLDGYDNCVSSFNKKKILCSIYQDKHCKPMPKGGGKLSDAVLHDITCWVKNNYPH